MSTDEVKKLIEENLAESRAEVTDLTGTGDHFKAVVISQSFKGKTRIQQHQLVYAALGELVGGAIHALQLTTHTEEPTD